MERATQIIADVLGVDKECVCEVSEFERDFGADSLDAVDLIRVFEKEFQISIDDDDSSKVETVGDAVDMVERLMKQS